MLPQVPVKPGRLFFFDLADPEKRTREDILKALSLITEFEKYFDVILGLNEKEAYEIGGRTKLDPTLILAIMAIESNFNPFAQSAVGAQGLMQVMTTVHTEKYQNFGGHFAAFDPVSNLRVGVKVLQECIARAGSIEGGLRYYVGAANLADDGGYTAKVMAEHARLKQVASGRSVPLNAPTMLSTQAPAAPAQATPATSRNTPSAAENDNKVALLTTGL